MSRIFDALQKAEHEQQSLQPETPAFQAAEVFTDAPHQGTSLAEGFHFDSVAVSSWNPSIAQLPALRGFDSGAEEFRRLRSRIYQLQETQDFKSILVTSGLPAEGKSFVSANLAISLARHQNRRILLMDADLRKPVQHKVLGASNKPGLSEYLAGTASPNEIVQRGNISNLAFIPAGETVENAAELVSNHRIEHLVAGLKSEFDWIIIDSSPVVPVSDAVNIARACDAVLLVARSASTPFDIAQRTVNEFKNSRVLGFVLNAIKKGSGRGDYYYYSYSGFETYVTPKVDAVAASS